MRYVLGSHAKFYALMSIKLMAFCCVWIPNRKSHALSKLSSSPITHQSHIDFQAGTAKNYIFNHFKKNDGHAMIDLLRLVKEFSFYQPPKETVLSVTDLGGGSGEMLEYLLPLAAQIIIHINEPDTIRRCEYERSAKTTPHVTVGQMLSEQLQTTPIPKSDIILSSHSLYYNTEEWHHGTTQTRHAFFNRILSSLNPKGVFCVILQSNAPTGLKKKDGDEIVNLESVENVVYPLISQVEQGKAIINSERKTFANAELLLAAIEKYHQTTQNNHHHSLFWRSSPPIVSVVPIGKINFQLNPKTQKYDQVSEVNDILNFYTRGLYHPSSDQVVGFSASQQKELLDFIYTHCQNPQGEYVFVHVNKVIVMMPDLFAKQGAHLQLSENYSTPRP